MPPQEKKNAAATASAPQYALVRSVSQHRKDGQFRRAGLRFDHNWRTLKIDDAAHLEAGKAGRHLQDEKAREGAVARAQQILVEGGVITSTIFRILEEETMLAVKPATSADMRDFEDAQAMATSSPNSMAAELLDMRRKIAELEAREVDRATGRPVPPPSVADKATP